MEKNLESLSKDELIAEIKTQQSRYRSTVDENHTLQDRIQELEGQLTAALAQLDCKSKDLPTPDLKGYLNALIKTQEGDIVEQDLFLIRDKQMHPEIEGLSIAQALEEYGHDNPIHLFLALTKALHERDKFENELHTLIANLFTNLSDETIKFVSEKVLKGLLRNLLT